MSLRKESIIYYFITMHYYQENMRGQKEASAQRFHCLKITLTSSSTSRIRRKAEFMYDTYMTGYAVFDISLKCDNKYLTVRSNFFYLYELFVKTISDTNFHLFFRGRQMSELVIIKPVRKPFHFPLTFCQQLSIWKQKLHRVPCRHA